MTPNPSTHGSPLRSFLSWGAVAIIGAWALGVIALQRGEPINAVWLIVAAICVYLIGYRFYSKFIAEKVLELDASRMTPAWRHNDGLDYVPTDKARGLFPVLVALRQWGEQYAFAPGDKFSALVDRKDELPLSKIQIRAHDGRLLEQTETKVLVPVSA